MGEDYASQLMASKPQKAEEVDWAKALASPRAPKQAADVEIANQDEASKGTAGFGTVTKSYMVDDPQTKIDIFAKSRFPQMPLEQARQRYGVIDGEVVYAGEDGKVYRETPSGWKGGGAKRFAAETLANAPAAIGGTVGAVSGAPAGPLAAAGGAMLGAAGGKGYGRVLAGMAFDEPQTTLGNVGGMAKESVFAGVPTVMGGYLGKLMAGTKARDISRLDPAQVAGIDQKASRLGIDLNVAQRTNLPSMKSRVDALSSMPTSRDIMAAADAKTSEQANAAVEKWLASISKVDGLDEAGTMGRAGAKEVLAKLTKERADQAAPFYNQAFNGFTGIPNAMLPQAAELMKRPSMAEAAKKAVRIAADEGLDLGDPKNSLKGMHYMKLALDKMIGDEAKGSFASTSRGALIRVKNDLVDMLDKASPMDKQGSSLYKKARGIYAHLSPNIDSVKDGVISRVADLSDEKLITASRSMFNPNMSPAAVTRARDLFQKAGRGDDWDALVRGHLQESFSKAGRDFVTTNGANGQAIRWRAAMMGDPAQKRILRNALSDSQYAALDDLSDVLEAVSRTYGAGGGSQTMPRQEAAKALASEATGKIGKVVNATTSPLKSLRDFIQEATVGNHAEKMARVMTSPDGVKRLKELSAMSPTSQKFVAGVSELFGISAAPVSRPNAEQVPPALQ